MILPRVKTIKKQGIESFLFDSKETNFNVLAFWQWSASDLLTNRQRGILAEFIVASSLNLLKNPREEWDSYDLVTLSGLKIEIKSASYIQSWEQEDYSKIIFSIQPTIKWEDNKRNTEKVRQADVYIFCLLKTKDVKLINPIDLSQWEFYIIETSILNEKLKGQKSITLSSLKKLNPYIVQYDEIKRTINTLK